MRYVLIGVLALIVAAVGYVFAWPVPIDPVEVAVGQNFGFTGPFTPNDALRNTRFTETVVGQGPEDVTVKDGYAYTGLEDGRVVRMRIDGLTPTGPAPIQPVIPGGPVSPVSGIGVETVATTGGRPLGLQHDPFGNIVVADAKRGLLAITPQGQVFEVAKTFAGRPLRFVDDLDIAKDGTIYFSDASTRHGYEEVPLDFYEGHATGRLFSFDPRTGQLQARMSDLAFANGVALGPDEEYVLVNETAAHRISRYWLKGPKQGQQDRFIENLPGYPDNISFNGRDLFWVALVGPRIKLLEDSYKSVSTRKMTFRLYQIGLAQLPTTPDPYGCVIAINTQGQVVATLQDPGGRTINTITSVNEKDGMLYLGGLAQDKIATIQVPPQLLQGIGPLPPR
jgi:sugar lactone lactonase YvrE